MDYEAPSEQAAAPATPAPAPSAPQKKHRGCGCLTLFLSFIGLAFLIVVVAFAIAVVNISRTPQRTVGDYGEDEFPDLSEVWSSGHGTVTVARISLAGIISLSRESSPLISSGSTESTLRAIRRATLDDSIRGILLEVDSGGGGVTASDILYDALKKFRAAQPGRFVVAHFGDTAASGAYYASLAADRIVAAPTAVTGSIGVIMPGINAHALAGKIGIEDSSVKSGENKDLMNPLAEPSPAQQAILQGVVDKLYDRFVALVAENRGLDEQKVREIADGRVMVAADALECGLVDSIGYEDDALAELASLLGEADLEVIRYEENFGFLDLFRNSNPLLGMESLVRGFSGQSSPRLLYQWLPR